MKAILNDLFNQKTLTKDQSKQILKEIGLGQYNSSQIVAFMAAYSMRSITVDELEGFRDAMLDMCVPANINPEFNTIDLCGTGGDGKDTFNISTAASFVVAGAGYKVTKHGNYGVSSLTGSSNLLEFFGYEFTANSQVLNAQLEESNFCFLHAPIFHPAMRTVAPLRKELGVKTFFNMLGPMTNPASPKNQVVGVFSLELLRLYAYLYQNTDINFCIVHSLDGYDEVSLTGKIKIFNNNKERMIEPSDLQMNRYAEKALNGGKTVEDAAKIFVNILENTATHAQLDVVLANAALAINCIEQHKSFEECLVIAKESVESGKALASFKSLIQQKKTIVPVK